MLMSDPRVLSLVAALFERGAKDAELDRSHEEPPEPPADTA